MKTMMKYFYGMAAFLLLMAVSSLQVYAQVKVLANVRPVHCQLNSNGAISLTVTGGTSPYQFQWSNGSQDKDLDNVAEGFYEVKVTDSKGLVTTQRIKVSTYSSLKVNILTKDVSSGNNNDGELAANVSGGKPPYQYHWISLSNTEMRFPTSGSIHHISAGNYMLAVQDANGCSAVVQAKVIHSNPAKK